MAAEVIARAQPLGNPTTVLLEVDVILGRIRREPRSVQHHQLEGRGQLRLSSPRDVAVTDAPVHEDQPLHGEPP
jgi:hypothetical protein